MGVTHWLRGVVSLTMDTSCLQSLRKNLDIVMGHELRIHWAGQCFASGVIESMFQDWKWATTGGFLFCL